MNVYSHDYNSAYIPAMPMIAIQLRRFASQPPILLEAIVDTGSDASLIPLRYLHQLQARKGHTQWLSGVAGGRYKVDLYAVSVQIGQYRPMYVNVVGTNKQDEVIIGRDVLNEFVVTLNAPAHVVELFG